MALLVSVLFSAIAGWCQQSDDHVFFDHRTPSTGVPFQWPSAWSDASSPTIRREDVLRLLVELHRDDPAGEIYAIRSFRFVPLEKDKFYLVADADVSGRDFFGSLQIVRCERADCVVGNDTTEAADMDSDLVDVNGDGVFEVITKERAGSYEGVGTLPIYRYFIRSLNSGELQDVSAKHPEYFEKHILPRMEANKQSVEAEIASLDKPQPLHVSDINGSKRLTPEEEDNKRRAAAELQEWKHKGTVELQYVQDDYHRRILGEKTAGLENALKWARSDETWLKEFGVGALEPIDSTTAAAELLRIANSKDFSLAEDARNALSRRAHARLAPPSTGGVVK